VQGEITNKIVEVCKVLNKHSVKYLIVGGTAVAFHGYFRWSVNSTASASEKFDLDIRYKIQMDIYMLEIILLMIYLTFVN
jgi:hypothetical protein